MKRKSVMVTNGGHRLYDDPNGEIVEYPDAMHHIEVLSELIHKKNKEIAALEHKINDRRAVPRRICE